MLFRSMVPYADFVAPVDVPVFKTAVAEARRVLRAPIKLGDAKAEAILGAEGVATVEHPWMNNIDHGLVAALDLVDPDDAEAWVAGARAIVGVAALPPTRGKSGRPRKSDQGNGLVRAVCKYWLSQGKTLENHWKRSPREDRIKGSAYSDDEHLPACDLAKLLCAVRDEFGIDVPNYRLETIMVAVIRDRGAGLFDTAEDLLREQDSVAFLWP